MNKHNDLEKTYLVSGDALLVVGVSILLLGIFAIGFIGGAHLYSKIGVLEEKVAWLEDKKLGNYKIKKIK